MKTKGGGSWEVMRKLIHHLAEFVVAPQAITGQEDMLKALSQIVSSLHTQACTPPQLGGTPGS